MPSNSAPRGTAIVSPFVLIGGRARPTPPARRLRPGEERAGAALLAGERHVQAVDAERESDRGHLTPEATEQLVVAAAPAQRAPSAGS